MNLQQMMAQAQKMQREMAKKQEALEATLFEITSCGGAIKVSIYGNYQIEKIEIDNDLVDPEDKEMLEDSIKIAVNEAINKIIAEQDKIQASVSKGMPGFGF